uniref:Uncharacterized protein n=1 Tax=Oryza meridionalis TaxID=40149 RepID=A0A0E0DNF9_9ORYZ
MDDRPKFTQIELRSGLVLLPPNYTPSRVARDGGKKKRGKAESVGSSIYPGVNDVEGVVDAAQGGLGFEKVKAAPAPATPALVASPSTASAKNNGGNGGGGYGNAGRGGNDAGWLSD